MTSSAVRARFSRSSSTSETNIAYCGQGSQASISATGSGSGGLSIRSCNGRTQTCRPSTGLVEGATPGTAS